MIAALSIALSASGNVGRAQDSMPSQSDPLFHFRSSLVQPPDASLLMLRQSLYVPVYSSVLGGAGLARLDLSVTLSIRNTSETASLVIESIDYFDTAGHLVQRYLNERVALRPLGTIEIFIPTEDIRGGTGANFIVTWSSTGPIAEPITEALMIGTSGTRGFAFVVQGRPIRISGK